MSRPDTFSFFLGSEANKIYPEAEKFFENKNIFIQLIRYWGEYKFDDDILTDISKALPYAIRDAEEHIGSPPWVFHIEDILNAVQETDFEEYVSDGKYFSILIPKNWSKDEAIMTRRNMKVYGVEITMPVQGEDEIPTKIIVEYYAKDNVLYKTPEEFIKRF